MKTDNIPTPQHDDEIDLLELMMTLWNQKWIIAGFTALCTLIAIIVAFMITPVYKTDSVIKPVNPHALYTLNNLGIYSVSSEGLFSSVEKELHSYNNREQFFLDNEQFFESILADVPEERREQVINRFISQNFKVKYPDKDETQKMIIVEMSYPQGINGPRVVNQFVNAMIDKVKAEIPEIVNTRIEFQRKDLQNQLAVLLAGYEAKVEANIATLTEKDELKRLQLQDELTALKAALKKQRENRIETLNEAIKIAEQLGFVKPTSPSSESSRSKSGNVIHAEINQQQMPLYFLGTEALTAERDTLLKRESDDFTSGRITEIEKELRLLENNRKIQLLEARTQPDLFLDEITAIKQKIAELNIAEKKTIDLINSHLPTIEIVNIDERAITPLSPLKPNKKLIAIIGLLLGGMLGVIFVLFREAMRNYQRRAAGKA